MNLQKIIERLEELTPKLHDLEIRMYANWGTESYGERCVNHGIRDELIKITESLKAQEESKSKDLKSILIDLETGAIDKYAAYDLITTLYAQSHQVEMPGDEEIMCYFNNHSQVTQAYIPTMTRSDVLRLVEWFKSKIK